MLTLKQIQSFHPSAHIIITDVGHWFTLPYKIAIDIASQLDGDVLNHVYDIIEQPLITKSYVDQTDCWVDIESFGNITAIKAKNLAYFLSSKIKDSVLYVNLNDLKINHENKLFIDFLQQHIPSLKIYFNTSENSCSQYLIYQNQKHTSYAINEELTLNNNLIFIETSNADTKLYYENLLSNVLTNSKLPKIAALKEPINSFAVEDIVKYAWSMAYMGATELAITILEKCYKENKNASYLINLQYIRLVTGYFQDVVAESYDDIVAHSAVTNKLYYAKAYCGVLSNNIQIAGEYFDKLGVNPGMPITGLQSLYCMNIYALYQHRTGNSETAFDIEHRIEKELNNSNEELVQIRYINSLNLARLYRFRGDIEKSKYYFDLAYEGINGLMTESDQVYINVNYASLYEKSGDLQKAFICWVRAALHWMSMRYPEALGWRAVRAILKRETHPNKEICLNEISNVLHTNISQLAQKLNIQLDKCFQHFNIIQLAHYTGSLENATYYGKDESLSFIATQSTCNDDWRYHQLAELKQLVLAAVDYFGCLPEESNTLIIDTDNDTIMPVLFSQALKRCCILNIEKISWNNIVYNVFEHKQDFLARLKIKISPSHALITNDNQPYASYKRYKKDYFIEPEVLSLLEKLQKNISIDVKEEYSSKFLRDLEKEKLICFET